MRAARAHTWCLACLSTVLLALPTAMSAARMQMTDVAKGYRMRRDIGQVWRNFHESAHRHLRTFLEDCVEDYTAFAGTPIRILAAYRARTRTLLPARPGPGR